MIRTGSKHRKGFTLSELCIVLALVAVVATIVTSFCLVVHQRSVISSARLNIVNEVNVVETFVERWVDKMSEKGATFSIAEDGTLTVELPSGRLLCYRSMTLGTNRWGKESLKFMGANSQTKRWEWIETYGGKLTENIVQAIARDCLAHTLTKVMERYDVVFHVHDEVIVEVDREDDLQTILGIMAQPLDWAPGLPLKGAGFCCEYYQKD